MAIDTLDKLIAGFQAPIPILKASQTAKAAGTWHSLFLAAGQPGASSTPATGSGAIPTSATAGALAFTNPVSGNSYLARFEGAASTVETLILYDRLWHRSGLAGNITTSQTVNSTALTRPDDNGEKVELWGEVYSVMGATAATFTATYTDQDGNASQSASYAMPASALVVGQMFPFSLAAGDNGVRSVQSIILSASTGGAGNFGLTLLRRVASIPLTLANIGMTQDAPSLGMPQIYNDACLALMVLCSTTNTGQIQGSIVLAQG